MPEAIELQEEPNIVSLAGERLLIMWRSMAIILSRRGFAMARQRGQSYLESHPDGPPPAPPKMLNGRPTAAHPWNQAARAGRQRAAARQRNA